MAEDYKPILASLDGDEHRARECFEVYLAGRAGFMPPAWNRPENDPYEFEPWVLSMIGARPLDPAGKKGADRGIDGVRYFVDEARGGQSLTKRMLVQVKSGHVKSGDIRDFVGTLSWEGAEMGVFLALESPTIAMKTEAATAGLYHSPWDKQDYPKVQVLTIEELLADPQRPNPRCLQVPGGTSAQHTLPEAPLHVGRKTPQGELEL